MALESATYINQLVDTNPLGSDVISQGDDHIKLIKEVLQASFPDVVGQASATIFTSASAPTSNVRGTIWYDTGNNLLKINTAVTGVSATWVTVNAGAPWASASKAESCAFRVSLSGNQTVSGTDTDAVEFDTVIYNIGSDFNTGTYKFTAPETGYFSLSVSTRWQGTTGAHSIDDDLYLIKTVSGPTESTIGYTSGWRQYTDSAGTPNYVQGYPTWQVHGVYALNSGDTVHADVHTEGGGLIVTSGAQTYFQGYQLT